ncbi:ABC transporter ATP-binding protein [Cognatishimia sp. SS12]|uniref:ABC transporter ATP-binding protein n=1 Tax=Cognatishimia sp. SS12 TaxID=2979465 RepID=UPI00232D4583|nr:ABC transporter ATP-binding protein [Cognatishimia sp. SS12]MDC0739337.1 ABC transporter ATP-binding protein [Cognatishimia sp. SS12]
MSDQTALDIQNLYVERGGKPVLHDISMSFLPGEITALIGANGAGKSSTVLAAAGAIPLKSGQVLLEGTPISGLSADAIRRRGVALVPEGHNVLSTLSVLDNLRVAGSHLPAKHINAAVDRVLALFPELSSRLPIPAGALSGGQKQMVLIGQALISAPKFMLVDELSLGLAPTIVSRLAETLQELANEGMGILLIEQFTTLALKIAEHAHVMERGRVVFSGTSKELLADSSILHSAYLATG